MTATNFTNQVPQQGAGQFRPQSLIGDIGGAVGGLFGSQQTGQTVGEVANQLAPIFASLFAGLKSAAARRTRSTPSPVPVRIQSCAELAATSRIISAIMNETR